jgi:hypothetical protein
MEKFATHTLVGTGYSVQHCGHPTANWPYVGWAPNGAMILAPNGQGFARLKEAKATVERIVGLRDEQHHARECPAWSPSGPSQYYGPADACTCGASS